MHSKCKTTNYIFNENNFLLSVILDRESGANGKCRDIFINETLGAERNKLLYEPRNSVFRYSGFSECIKFPNSMHGVTANKVRFQHVNALEFIYITVDRGC